VNADLLSQISTAIGDAGNRPFELRKTAAVSGGNINEALRLEGTDGSRYFLKLNDARHHAMFAAEAAGLEALAASGAVRVPRAIAHGQRGNRSYLVLEHLELQARGQDKQLGEQLAALHRCPADRFGYMQDNFIGTTPQSNAWTDDWIAFWREQRLGFQLQLAADNGYNGTLQQLGARLLDALPAFFEGYTPQPSLLHGDLWGGNHAFLADGTPVVFDPAIYYGDRESDLAMTELFGGFSAAFYDAYRSTWPLHEGYANRRDLYNLYHMLNHINLFDGGYVRQAEQTMQRLLLIYG
jgi:protein-ribulosamine 3-kinase